MERREGRIVNATDNACRVLDALRRLDGAGVTELSDELDYTQSAVHAQLNTLRANGFVVKDGSTYRLSLQFLDFARSVTSRFGNFDLIRSEMNSLAEETDEVAQFATDERGKIVYLDKARGENAVKTGSFMGKREHLHSTAMGKAILSTKSDEEIDRLIEQHGLPEQTKNTATDREELLDRLADVREQGYAVDDEENVRGLRCIASPVMVSETENLGSVGITGPASRMTDERIESELAELVKSSANLIEVNYKFS
jgi:IclR family KDG regulon transcriptional repressor